MIREIKKAGKLLAPYFIVMIPINILGAVLTNYAYPVCASACSHSDTAPEYCSRHYPSSRRWSSLRSRSPCLTMFLCSSAPYFFFLPYSNVILKLLGPQTLQGILVPVVSLFWFPVVGLFWLAGIAGTFVGAVIGYHWFEGTLPHRIHRIITGGVF